MSRLQYCQALDWIKKVVWFLWGMISILDFILRYLTNTDKNPFISSFLKVFSGGGGGGMQ